MISIHSREFRQPIENSIASGKKVIVWHQLPFSGGLQEWFLIDTLDGLDAVISTGEISSAFTAYEWIEVVPLQKIDQTWFEQTLASLQKETHNQMLLIQPVSEENSGIVTLIWIGEKMIFSSIIKTR